jgi:3-deoxy-manno-octulosonate cytidylyltransferase (CMP-KDO synthetase)
VFNNHSVYIYIPSRYQSSRFEGKPLADILGKTMIERVYERASMVENADDIQVLTDDHRIVDEVKEFKGNVMMTLSEHRSGTDRIIEVVKNQGIDGIIINLQGDEPLISPELIEDIIHQFKNEDVEIVTACSQITTSDDLFNYNIVKVVRSSSEDALYFSRNAIPAFKDLPYREWLFNTSYYKHIGIYAFRSEVLKEIAQLNVSNLEKAESLEQLRWLEAGFKIKCILTDYESISVDTPDDVELVVQAIVSQNIDPFIDHTKFDV